MPELLTRPGFWLAAYLAVMNLAAFGAYGADKRRAGAGAGASRSGRCFCCPCWAAAWARCWACMCSATRPGTGISAGEFPLFSFSNWLPAAPYGTWAGDLPLFLPQGAVIFPIAAPCNFSGHSIGCASLSKILFDKLQGLFRPFIKVLKRR